MSNGDHKEKLNIVIDHGDETCISLAYLHTTQAIKQENEVGNDLGRASGLGCG